MAAEVHGDLSRSRDYRHLYRRLRSPKHGPDAGEQLIGAERLGEIVVRAHIERPNLVGLVAARADHDHRREAAAFEGGEDMPTIHKWQADVEQDDVEGFRRECLHARGAVGGELHLVAAGLESGHYGIAKRPIVLHYQDLGGHRRLYLPATT